MKKKINNVFFGFWVEMKLEISAEKIFSFLLWL